MLDGVAGATYIISLVPKGKHASLLDRLSPQSISPLGHKRKFVMPGDQIQGPAGGRFGVLKTRAKAIQAVRS